MAKNLKKLLSLVLAMIMVLSLIPAVSATETTEPEATEPAATEPTETEPEATEPDDGTIKIATADEWHDWFMRTTSKLITEYGNKGETAKFTLTEDIRVTPNNLYYIGTTAGVTVQAEIDLGGHTLTVTGTNSNRVFGIYSGSELTIKNGTIVLDKPFGEVNGGLFFVSNGTLNLTDLTVNDIGEYEFHTNGKLLHVSAGHTATLTNVTMTGNTKASTSKYKADGNFQYGEGGLINNTGNLIATNCTFAANTTTNATENKYMIQYGGLVNANSAGTTSFTGCTFEGGIAAFGGALCVKSGSATVSGCTFLNNQGNYGGAIQVRDKAYLKLENSTITGANAKVRAGAIDIYAGTAAKTLEMIDTDITGCSAPNGGAIAAYGRGVSTIQGGTISDCHATGEKGHGGGLYCYNNGWTGGTPTLTITDTVFDGCTAYEAGNIHVQNENKYKPCILELNNVTLKNGVATGTGVYAGNIYTAGVDYTDANGTLLHCTINLNGCTIEGGKANYGGNVGVAGHTTVNLTDCVLRDGEVTGTACGGGNFYMGNAKAVTNMYNTTLIGGKTQTYGGNIRVGGGRLNFYSGLIEGGEGSGTGKTILVNGNVNAFMYVYGGTIRATADKDAVIAWAGGNLKLLNCETENFDPTAFVPYGEAAATQTGETTATIRHLCVDGATTKIGTCEETGTVTIVCAECDHTYVYENQEGHCIVIDKAVAATCTDSGLTEGQHCAICDYAVAQEVVPATGHAPAEAVKENEVPHTCTEDGSYDFVIYCETCKVELERTTGVVDPAAHTEQTVEGKAPTCTEDGLTEGKICSVCNETLVAQETIPAAHTEQTVEGKAPTCTETGLTEGKICSVCQEVLVAQDEIPVAEHAWDEGVYTDPTTEADGYTTFTCGVCGETKTEVDEGSKLPEVVPSVITKQPETVTVETGETVQFHVEAEGDIVSYKWEYRKVSKWFSTSMTGYNTDTLTVPATGARNGYGYRCTITFADGTVLVSDVARLYVNTYITITGNPNNQVVVNGFKGQFTAAAEGEGLKYRWYYQRPDGEVWSETSMEGCEKPTVYIESTAARNGYKYRCKIIDVTGKVVYTEPATMTVLTFTSHPVETFAATGDTVTFTVETSTLEGFSYQWQYRRNANGNWSDTTLTGCKTATLTVPAKGKNGYEYRCVLTGSKNSQLASKGAVLHVGDPVVIAAQTEAVTAAVGEVATFTVEATNAYSYQWYYQRPGGTTWTKTGADGNATATVNVTVKANNNGYKYRCEIKGLDGQLYYTEPATLTVE